MSAINPDDVHAHAESRASAAAPNDETTNDMMTATTDDKKQTIAPLKPQDSRSPTTSSANGPPPLLTKALQFAANATPGILGAVSLGVSAVLYVAMGRVGLLLIGAFAGVLGFVTLEARHPEVAKAVRGEKGLDVLERLQLSTNHAKSEDASLFEDDEQYTLKALDEFRPETREAIGGLIDAVIRDYVKWWYNPIVPSDHAFPLACRKTLTSYLLSISNHLYRKRPADAFLDLLTNASSMLIVFMSELASAFADLDDSNMSAVEALYNYRASNPDCNLNNLLNQHHQATKFKAVAGDLLAFLDRKSRDCDPARVFLREILANSVLESALQTCSKADWLNGWIVHLLEAGEPDLNQAIDVGMQTGREPTPNLFADMDGNTGNMAIAKPARSSTDGGARPKGAAQMHKKKLSKADEEMEVAVEEMKKLNKLIIKEETERRGRADTIRTSADIGTKSIDNEHITRSAGLGGLSPTTVQSGSRETPLDDSTDGLSTKSEAIPTPITPRSPAGSNSDKASPKQDTGRFTSFDQIQPHSQIKEEMDEPQKVPAKKEPLTLHNAAFTVHDDTNGEQGKMRNKPHWDYLIQVEPSSAHYPGWMIVRRYSDFETLHEIMRRIAMISGATAFAELHRELPAWKIHTRESLRGELERYLRDACWYSSLAESEGMKRFLEKSQGHTHGESKSFGWDIVGKNMLDVLTTAPKGAMEGGKTLVGGVQGVFGNFPGLSRKTTSQSVDLTSSASSNRLSISTPPRMETKSPARSDRASMESQRSSIVSTQPGKVAPMERRPSYQSQLGDEGDYFRQSRMDSLSGPGSARASREHSRASSLAPLRSPSTMSLGDLRLPPHPDEIADDYTGSPYASEHAHTRTGSTQLYPESRSSLQSPNTATSPGVPPSGKKVAANKLARQFSQLSEGETRVAVELLFAVINEMYTLSSAWNIRRTLLAAAKSFLLRPGNPSLLTVQNLIQTTVLDTVSSDAGIAEQLRKLRENTMPTEEERAHWPAPLTSEESEKLRVRARQLLIRSGVPAALMGVMGQAATSEALGRVFDCLQIEEVARGLVFGILLQLVGVVTG
ncbi:uncharacterized protein J7T54_005536 [Emericellopsis cladophorae]|uniref:PXA domain-containing protein n=1 Tax=Emericellopsis cladophorae TaxID=2686198 RepID=A0A9P9Y4T2_9HYPO|nr:uncharacterized protein J7T54_005536 [Emericellopsis cladophorae]KAI6783507.1 hypothetical protein J7T54_005536 [Emericellopsis cladophorae]